MLKENALKNKTIIVTGGGSGLGLSMTREFLKLGANAVITSRNMEKLEKVKAELEAETGGTVLPIACDVRNYEEVEQMVRYNHHRVLCSEIGVFNARTRGPVALSSNLLDGATFKISTQAGYAGHFAVLQ